MDFRFWILDCGPGNPFLPACSCHRRANRFAPAHPWDRFKEGSARRILGGLFLIVGLAMFPSPAPCETASGSVRKANKLYVEGKYEEALKEYKAAQVNSPDDERIMLNMGNAQYKLGHYDEALSGYAMSAGNADPKIRAQSYYNAGNSLYRIGKLEEAVDQYRKALENDPNDEDAKYNLEFVQREINRRMNEQQKRQQEQGKKGQQKQEPKQGAPNQQPEQQKGRQGQNQQQEAPQQGKKQEENPPPEKREQSGAVQEADRQQAGASEQSGNAQAAQVEQDAKMDKENVQRWLEAVEAESAENMKEFLRKQQQGQVVTNPKDW